MDNACHMKPTLLVLAAGMGSRYGGLKQLDVFGPNGETMLDYAAYDAIRAGFGKVVYVVRKNFAEEIRAKVISRFEGRIQVELVNQELDVLPAGFSVPAGREKPWGTGHAIWVAREAIREPFAIVNADDFYGPSSYQAIADYLRGHEGEAGRYAAVGFILRNTLSRYGSCSRGICQLDDQGRMMHVVEHTRIEAQGRGALSYNGSGNPHPLTGDEITSMNMWGFDPSIFEHLDRQLREFLGRLEDPLKQECYIPFVVDRLIQEGRAVVQVLPSHEEWFGVTYSQDKQSAVEALRLRIEAGQYPRRLWS